MTRRVQRVLLGLAAVVALGAAGALLVGFVWPEGGTEFDLGPVESFAPGTVSSFYVAPGSDEVESFESYEHLGPEVPVNCRLGGTLIHVVRLEDGTFLALWGRSPHLGQVLPWRPEFIFDGRPGWFRDPCQGSTFEMDGTRFYGPSPRDMDRFRLWIEDGRVHVDIADVTEGYRYPQKRATPPPAGWTPQPTALATDPLPDPNEAPSPSLTLPVP